MNFTVNKRFFFQFLIVFLSKIKSAKEILPRTFSAGRGQLPGFYFLRVLIVCEKYLLRRVSEKFRNFQQPSDGL